MKKQIPLSVYVSALKIHSHIFVSLHPLTTLQEFFLSCGYIDTYDLRKAVSLSDWI